MLPQALRQFLDGHPVDPRTPLVGPHLEQRFSQILSLTYLLHQGCFLSRAFGCSLHPERFGPFCRAHESFTPAVPQEGLLYWCFLPLVAHEVRFLITTLFVRAFASVSSATTPSADFCSAIRIALRLSQSCCHDTEQISWGKSNCLPRAMAGSTLLVLDGYGLRRRRLARPTLAPPIRFLFINPRFCSTLLSDAPSRSRPCASLTLHLHQVG
jgi:hypothetical protein